MSKTEEGRLKEDIKEYLRQLGWKPNSADSLVRVRVLMPVQNGMSTPALDFILCYNGRYYEIETKSKGKKPTARQRLIGELVTKAGGYAFWCDSFESFLFNASCTGLVPPDHPHYARKKLKVPR